MSSTGPYAAAHRGNRAERIQHRAPGRGRRPETRFEEGLATQKRIFGDAIDRMYAQAPKDQLHIQHYLSANCFGDYYTRTGLDLKTRELLTFAILASLGGCEPQLASHVAGNVALGNDRRVLVSTITQLLPSGRRSNRPATVPSNRWV